MASIALDDALILSHRANPRWMEFSGTTAALKRFPIGTIALAQDSFDHSKTR
jgi:hypothetical protein